MPHISKIELPNDIQEKLINQLLRTIEKAVGKNALKYISSELLTHTEKIMLSKRLAVVLLLDKRIPQHVIEKELHMSPSTIAKISLKMDKGKFRAVRNIAGKKTILDILEKLALARVDRGIGKHINKSTTIYRSTFNIFHYLAYCIIKRRTAG